VELWEQSPLCVSFGWNFVWWHIWRLRSKIRVEIGTGSRIPPPGGVVSNLIFGANLRHRTRYLHRKWGPNVWNDASFKHPRWRMAAIFNQLNRYNSAEDCPISLKFCTTTDMKLPPDNTRPGKLPARTPPPRRSAWTDALSCSPLCEAAGRCPLRYPSPHNFSIPSPNWTCRIRPWNKQDDLCCTCIYRASGSQRAAHSVCLCNYTPPPPRLSPPGWLLVCWAAGSRDVLRHCQETATRRRY